MYIGLYFGSFNPIHNGHLAIAQYMQTNYPLDEIWFVISPNSPFKQVEDMLEAEKRLHLLKLAIENYPFFRASNIEFDMPLPSYTYRTLRKLRADMPNNQYALIMGSDNIDNITQWKNYMEILQFHTIYVYPRQKDVKKQSFSNIIYTNHVPILPISASAIRVLISQCQWDKVSELVPYKVLCELKSRKYYK